MDLKSIANSIIVSRLWVKGCSNIIFENDFWTFYYCIEGTDCKFWNLCFYNSKQHRIYIRNEIIDLKIDNVIIQTASFVSNIYTMLIEFISKPVLWIPKSDMPLRKKSCMSALGILNCEIEETYACAPPILLYDSFTDLVIEQTQELPYELHDPTKINNTCIYKVNNYPTYIGVKSNKKSVHHEYHFNKTYIPKISVNSITFNCKFEISFEIPRDESECLECCSPWKGEVHSSSISNLMINH